MRKLFIILFFFCFASEIFSQPTNFETGIQEGFYGGINKISYQNDGSYITAGFYDEAVLSKFDSLGNILWVKKTYAFIFFDIINSADGNVICAGQMSPCDVGGAFAFLQKYSTSGNLIWELKYYGNGGGFDPPILNHIKETRSGKIISTADSTLNCSSSIGDSLWSKNYSYGLIHSLEINLKNQFIIGTDKGIIKTDSAGNFIDFYDLQSMINNIIPNYDSTYLITTGTTIYKLDKSFSIIDTLDLSSHYSQFNVIKKSKNGLWASGDSKVSKIDSTTLQYLFSSTFTGCSIRDLNIEGKKLVVGGLELTNASYHQFIKSFDYSGNHQNVNTDIGITNIKIDSAYVFHPMGYPMGVCFSYFDITVTVKNFGDTLVDHFFINAFMPDWHPMCGPGTYVGAFNTTILSGDSISISLPSMGGAFSGCGSFKHPGYCFWTSDPVEKIDKDHSNDSFCTDSVYFIVSIDELFSSNQYIKAYPNPTNDDIVLNLDVLLLNQKVEYQVCNIVGQIVDAGEITTAETKINLPEQTGMYFLKVFNEANSKQIKLIKN